MVLELICAGVRLGDDVLRSTMGRVLQVPILRRQSEANIFCFCLCFTYGAHA